VARTPRSSDLPVQTSEGPALVHLTEPAGPRRGRLVLGHGAGGGVQAPDLQAVRSAAVAAGWAVALVVQPWKVAGRKVATAPPRLDAAWREVLAALVDGPLAGPSPLVLGGRSAGARVACRTADGLGAAAVCCLAFPLHPPGRPERSRAAELPGDLPVLVVQGRKDPFGGPEDVAAVAPASVRVEAVEGDHGMKASAARAGELVAQWLQDLA
jgi:hypothetical protein